MQGNRRETILKIAVGVVVGLFLLDRVVLGPATAAWRKQGERLADLEQKVERGRQLLEREQSIRGRWNEMLRTDLPEDSSVAENDVLKALSRWTRDSRVGFTSLTQATRDFPDEGYTTNEWRATAVGDQASLGRLVYEIETDPMPARMEDYEITTRDAQGRQLGMSLRFSFVRINEGGSR